MSDSVTLHSISVPAYIQSLGAMAGWFDKAGDDALLEAKLAEDMFPLSAQVRIACDQAMGTLRRLTSKAIVLSDDNDKTIEAAKARIAQVIEVLQGVTASDFPAPDSAVPLDLPMGLSFDFTALEYVRDWAVPQFYFHVSTAYAILRMKGVALGKADYLSYAMKFLRKAPATA